MFVAIEVEQLAKRYAGGHEVLRDVTFHVEEGEIVACLAGEGGGKTTTVRILTGLVRPTAGRARVAGVDVVERRGEVQARTGVTLREAARHGMQSGREFLVLVGSLWGLSFEAARARADELLELLELTGAAELRLSVCPTPLRRRLDLAASLVRAPEVLFLDAPATGLGPGGRHALWDEVRHLRAGGATVFMTTRSLEEAEAVADRLVVLRDGCSQELDLPLEPVEAA
jgi:ABC-type multidrug transport system ATPase subunit